MRLRLVRLSCGLATFSRRRHNLGRLATWKMKHCSSGRSSQSSEEQAREHVAGSGVLSDEFYTWLVQVSADTLRDAIEKVGVASY